MPVLVVYGMPSNQSKKLPGLIDWLRSTGVLTLGLNKVDISVFFPVDLVKEGLGEELICLIEGMFEYPERTAEVRKQFAEAIKKVLATFAKASIHQCRNVEVRISRFDQLRDGFATCDPRHFKA